MNADPVCLWEATTSSCLDETSPCEMFQEKSLCSYSEDCKWIPNTTTTTRDPNQPPPPPTTAPPPIQRCGALPGEEEEEQFCATIPTQMMCTQSEDCVWKTIFPGQDPGAGLGPEAEPEMPLYVNTPDTDGHCAPIFGEEVHEDYCWRLNTEMSCGGHEAMAGCGWESDHCEYEHLEHDPEEMEHPGLSGTRSSFTLRQTKRRQAELTNESISLFATIFLVAFFVACFLTIYFNSCTYYCSKRRNFQSESLEVLVHT